MNNRKVNPILTVMLVLCTTTAFAADKKLKVYILVGQSNMQGHAHVKTLPHMAADPKSKSLCDQFVDADGEPHVYDQVRVVAFSEMDAWGNPKPEQTAKNGPLTIGFGSHLRDPNKFGPELGFGITMNEQLQQPILIIKTAWGGKSLLRDFRPPSAGPYDAALSADEKTLARGREEEWRQKHGKKEAEKWKLSVEEILKLRRTAEGRYYRWMVEHVKEVLENPVSYHPAYDGETGYEVAGFVWFQGFNDLVGGSKYKAWGGHAAYGDWLACLIRDLRKEFSAPDMPVVIGVMGVGGEIEDMEEGKQLDSHTLFRAAMAAPAALPEFEGRVVAVQTAPYWPIDVAKIDRKVAECKKQADREKNAKKKADPEMGDRELNVWRRERVEQLINETLTAEERRLKHIGISNWSLHYFGNAKCIGQMGEAFAKALLEIE